MTVPSVANLLQPHRIALIAQNMKFQSFVQVNIAIPFLLIGLAGCQSKTDESTQVVTPPPSSNEVADATETVASETAASKSKFKDAHSSTESSDTSSAEFVATFKMASWEDAYKTASTSGKVTVVDVWSTVCVPCLKELPGLVELHKELGDQVLCMTVDVDFDGRKSKPPLTYEKDVVAVLSSVGADFPNFICTTASDDVYAAAEIDSIPAVFVFDADGKLVKKYVDAGEGVGFGYHKDVIPLVKTLIK
ncbi:MAG: TlpA disulfide reductase family protein [Pirellulaceae bacterium]